MSLACYCNAMIAVGLSGFTAVLAGIALRRDGLAYLGGALQLLFVAGLYYLVVGGLR